MTVFRGGFVTPPFWVTIFYCLWILQGRDGVYMMYMWLLGHHMALVEAAGLSAQSLRVTVPNKAATVIYTNISLALRKKKKSFVDRKWWNQDNKVNLNKRKLVDNEDELEFTWVAVMFFKQHNRSEERKGNQDKSKGKMSSQNVSSNSLWADVMVPCLSLLCCDWDCCDDLLGLSVFPSSFTPIPLQDPSCLALVIISRLSTCPPCLCPATLR